MPSPRRDWNDNLRTSASDPYPNAKGSAHIAESLFAALADAGVWNELVEGAVTTAR